MFSTYFYIAKGGEVKVKDTVDLNSAQQIVAQRLLTNINQGIEIMDYLNERSPGEVEVLTAAAAMGMALSRLYEASKDQSFVLVGGRG